MDWEVKLETWKFATPGGHRRQKDRGRKTQTSEAKISRTLEPCLLFKVWSADCSTPGACRDAGSRARPALLAQNLYSDKVAGQSAQQCWPMLLVLRPSGWQSSRGDSCAQVTEDLGLYVPTGGPGMWGRPGMAVVVAEQRTVLLLV